MNYSKTVEEITKDTVPLVGDKGASVGVMSKNRHSQEIPLPANLF